MTTSVIDIVRNAEKTDALGLQKSVNDVLSTKAFEKLEDMKKSIASTLLVKSNDEGDD